MIPVWLRVGLFALPLVLLPAFADGADEFEIVESHGFRPRFLEPDARSLAMGTAFTAIVDGPAAAYWNLGALGLPGPSGRFSYSTREIGGRYHLFNVTGSRDGIGVGGHFTMMRNENQVRTVFDPSDPQSVGISHYFGIIGAGIEVGRYIPGLPQGMEWGAGLGIVLARNEIVNSEGEGWDMDLGTILSWRLPPEPSEGAASAVLRTGYALHDMWDRSIDVDGAAIPLGRQDRIGVAATLESTFDSRFGPLVQGTISWERRGLFYDWAGSRNQAGGEITFAGLLSFRTGYIWSEPQSIDRFSWGIGIGLEPGNPVSAGIGMRLDYAEAERNFGPDFDQFTASIWITL